MAERERAETGDGAPLSSSPHCAFASPCILLLLPPDPRPPGPSALPLIMSSSVGSSHGDPPLSSCRPSACPSYNYVSSVGPWHGVPLQGGPAPLLPQGLASRARSLCPRRQRAFEPSSVSLHAAHCVSCLVAGSPPLAPLLFRLSSLQNARLDAEQRSMEEPRAARGGRRKW